MVRYNPYAGEPEPDEITLAEYAASWIDMDAHYQQLMDLASQVKTIVEFGLRGGVSTWAMLDGLPEDGRLIGVDIDPNALIARRVKADPRFTFIVGDSVKVKLPRKADLVMIDSEHTYEQTVKELAVAAKMKPRYIVLHDYLELWWGKFISQAVDEFVETSPYRIEIIHQSFYGLAVLVPK